MGLLDRAGARLTVHPEEAEILVVNTCSFIDTAKQESVDTILEMARFQTSGSARKLIVAGCLVERYRDEIKKNIPKWMRSWAPVNSSPSSRPPASPCPKPPFPHRPSISSPAPQRRLGREKKRQAGTHKAHES